MVIVPSDTLAGRSWSLTCRRCRRELVGCRLKFAKEIEARAGLVVHSVPARLKGIAVSRDIINFEISKVISNR